MNKDTLKQLKALDAAGDKANDKKWLSVFAIGEVSKDLKFPCIEIYCENERGTRYSPRATNEDLHYFVLAANSRPAIKSAIAEIEAKDREIERLRGALEEIRCDAQEFSFYGGDELVKEMMQKATQALGACEATERSEDNDE